MRKRRPDWVRKLAKGFMMRLLELAETTYRRDRELGKRYAELAVRTSRKYNVRIPKEYKRRICKKCNAFLIPGFNARVRISTSTRTVVWICEECGNVKRYGYAKEKSKGAKTPSEDREEGSNPGHNPRNKKTPRNKGTNKNKGLKK